MTAMRNDFFEDDEPIEKINAVLSRPSDGVTEEPLRVVSFASGSETSVFRGNQLRDGAAHRSTV